MPKINHYRDFCQNYYSDDLFIYPNLMTGNEFEIKVATEVGTLRRLLIHSPDSGLGKVVPSKAQDWLFEDIVHLDTIRKDEYDYYVKILLYFLDPGKIRGRVTEIDSENSRRNFFKPGNRYFHASEKVIEVESLLEDILQDNDIKRKLVASVCAIEGCTYRLQEELINTSASELCRLFISGSLPDEKMIFAPVPNLIFTRDIGIIINSHILINKPAKKARARETLLIRYIFFNHPVFKNYRDKILEIPDAEPSFLRPGENQGLKTAIEGGDIMVVSADHVLIGWSERTSASGASEVIKILFENKVVSKATVVKIPHKRDFMHIDTVFSQVKRNMWVLLRSIGSPDVFRGTEPIDYLSGHRNPERPEIIQFERGNINHPSKFESIEDLLDDISRNDLKSTEETQFIYSGNDIFPFDAREQWTDSCNLLAIREGIVLGYDRNEMTSDAFRAKGFNVIKAAELLDRFEKNELLPERLTNTLILMPSSELSRARGGFHCMSMPLLRDPV